MSKEEFIEKIKSLNEQINTLKSDFLSEHVKVVKGDKVRVISRLHHSAPLVEHVCYFNSAKIEVTIYKKTRKYLFI